MLILIFKLWFLLITILTAMVVVGFLHEAFLHGEAWSWFGIFVYGCLSIYAGKLFLAPLNYKETPDLPNPPAGGVGGEEE